MASIKKPQRLWVLAPVGGVVLLVTIGLELLEPHGTRLDYVVRGLAMCAYQVIFLSIISSNYIRELVRFFGKPFIKVHHVATVTALVLILLHPVGVAWNWSMPAVFIPDVSSLGNFLTNAGRPAWYLFGLAALAAVLRKRLGNTWRTIHWLTYLAFVFATVHGTLLGSNMGFLPVRIVMALMALAVVAVFIRKRLAKPARPAASRPKVA